MCVSLRVSFNVIFPLLFQHVRHEQWMRLSLVNWWIYSLLLHTDVAVFASDQVNVLWKFVPQLSSLASILSPLFFALLSSCHSSDIRWCFKHWGVGVGERGGAGWGRGVRGGLRVWTWLTLSAVANWFCWVDSVTIGHDTQIIIRDENIFSMRFVKILCNIMLAVGVCV